MPFLLVCLILLARTCLGEVHHAQGEMAGEITDTSVFLQSRLTAIPGPDLGAQGDIPGSFGVACFEWSDQPDFSAAQRTSWMQAEPDRDFIVRTPLTGLRPGTAYVYRLIFGEATTATKTGPTRHFKTLGTGDPHVSFCMGSCMNYYPFMSGKANGGGPISATPEDKRLGYPVFAAMHALKPDFFIGTGDIVYYDQPSQSPASTLTELRKKWHEQFRFPRLVEFFAHTPAYWSKDDHDFRFNDADLLKPGKLPAPATGIEVFREQMPLVAIGDLSTPTYRTHRIHRHVQLWFTEGRDFRSPNASPDGPEKSLWGSAQREWLRRTLQESDATWKIIISPTPMIGPDDANKRDNHANLGGFKHEADSFFAWARAQGIQRLMTFCGDRHWQYHSIHPSGVEEFACGALNDENSRRGVPPGKGTDPEALIRQPYTYAEPTGGFLRVVITSAPDTEATLRIEFRDDTGTVLYETIKHPTR